jgi:NADH-quinone oxidoreductase subunit M
MPVWAFFMVFFTMASVGLPGLNGFVSEVMCLMGAFQSGAAADGAAGVGAAPGVFGPWYAAVAGAGMIVAAMYLLYMVGHIVFGPLKEPGGHGHGHGSGGHDDHAHSALPKDLSFREIAVLTPLAIGCVVLGVYPTPMIRTLEAPIVTTLRPTAIAMEQHGMIQPAGSKPASIETKAAPTDAHAEAKP